MNAAWPGPYAYRIKTFLIDRHEDNVATRRPLQSFETKAGNHVVDVIGEWLYCRPNWHGAHKSDQRGPNSE
ncbi:hypothetical protein GCM10010924_53130 [Rhizobium wenxiniae]|nr:hypothetical protein GCM10010924_53130 [Rhizobium wenxiniae]